MAGHRGHCLCGAVTVIAGELKDNLSACHCDMCTRWSGGVQMFIDAPEETVTMSGPIRTYRSSPFAERAWCDVCGSAIYLRNVEGDVGTIEFSPGLFDKAAGARLTRVVYSDRAPGGAQLGGDDVERVTKAQYEAQFDFVPEDRP